VLAVLEAANLSLQGSGRRVDLALGALLEGVA
jgi:hypothetical protein